ncbi:MAG: hypothetical protein P1P83_06305 [Bacteroidales bacterium]|nr:hypothetical protein [Bacteroidales bacterium]MDT8373388.1 hypothetical protein [Bacteroidales bacterium]
MRKLIILFVFLFACTILNSQDSRFYRSYPQSTPDSLLTPGVVIRNDIANMQYCMGKYYQERRIAAYCEIGSAVTFASFYVVAVYTDLDGLDRMLLASSVALAAATLIIYIDSDKWLKRGSIKLMPGSIRVYF